MRIGINGFLAARGTGGLARHTLVLLDALLRLTTEHEFVVFSDRPLPARFSDDPRVASRVMRWPRYTLWEQLGLPMAMHGADLDLFFGPAYGLPLLSPVPAIVMLHDLAFRRVPQAFPRKKRGYYELFAGVSARKARRVITPSHSAAVDAHTLLGVPTDRLDVVHNAVDPRFHPVQDSMVLTAVREKYGLPDHFILYLGTIEPRKNLERLMEAYAFALRHLAVAVPLVLAGPLGWLYEGIVSHPSRLGIDGYIIRPGAIDDADLPALYSAADLFAYPSLYEGFGLPIVEAMACGTPVLTSTSSSLPEVAGNAAVQVDPMDVHPMAQALSLVLHSRELRDRLREAALHRAALFTPQAMAERTLASFDRAVRAPEAIGALV